MSESLPEPPVVDAPTPAGRVAVTAAASAEHAAVAQSTVTGSTSTISPPAAAGPAISTAPLMPSRSPGQPLQ
jgi:hypothetical protein